MLAVGISVELEDTQYTELDRLFDPDLRVNELPCQGLLESITMLDAGSFRNALGAVVFRFHGT